MKNGEGARREKKGLQKSRRHSRRNIDEVRDDDGDRSGGAEEARGATAEPRPQPMQF